MLKKIINYLKSSKVDCFTLSHSTSKLAFTLAETLIVMGIIGVVAALTLPNLNSSTGDKEKVAKVKKIYQNLNDAFGRAEAVYGPIDEWCAPAVSCTVRSFERIVEFMKVSKKCTTVSSCGVNGIFIDGNGSGGASSVATAILADGSAISFDGDNESGKQLGKGNYHFTVDIDGPKKGANKQGTDVFCFFVNHEKGVYVEDIFSNSSKYVDETPRGANCRSNKCFYDQEATAWVVNFDNMDYLKTTDGTTCPDGKTKLTVGGNHSCK